MNTSSLNMAQQIAEAATIFHHRNTGHAPRTVNVVLSNDTIVLTMQDALSPAEIELARTADGASRVQDYHRQLFESSAHVLRQEIRRITGVGVQAAAVEVETTPGAVVHVFTTGTMVQVFQLADGIPLATWSGTPEGTQPAGDRSPG